MRFGIEKSRNLMTVRLANDMGMPIIVEYARRFGVYDNLMPMLSMALGAGETTLLRMVGAYGMIANGGKQISPTLIDRIQDRYGRTIWQHDDRDCVNCDAREWSGQDEPELVDDRPQIIDPMSAYQMVSIMEGVVQRGTAQKLKVLERPIAGKTGTTNDEKDGWFIGFTPDLVVGAYMGFDNPSPMGHGETGGNVSAPIVREFFRIALADQPPIPFRAPTGIKFVRVNLKTGLPAGHNDPKAIMEAFKPTQDPLGAVATDTGGACHKRSSARLDLSRLSLESFETGMPVRRRPRYPKSPRPPYGPRGLSRRYHRHDRRPHPRLRLECWGVYSAGSE